MSARLASYYREFLQAQDDAGYPVPVHLRESIGAAFCAMGEHRINRILDDFARAYTSSINGAPAISALSIGAALRPALDSDDQKLRLLLGLIFGWGGMSAVDPHDLSEFHWTARWVELAMPAVSLSEDQVTSFALSDLDATHISELRSPWSAFLIKLPKGALPLVTDAGATTSVDLISVSFYASASSEGNCANGKCEITLRSDCCQLHSGELTIAELYQSGVLDDENLRGRLEAVTALDKRTLRAAARVALSTVAHLHNGEASKLTRHRSGPRKGKPIFRSPGQWSEYVIGADVKVHPCVREALDAYLTGQSDRTYKVSWVTRGHWRNQPHGPRNSLRRRTWIGPHWNRAKQGPANVRDHVLVDNQGEPDAREQALEGRIG